MEPRRVVAVGDVHGCLEELRELLQVIEYKPGQTRLVFLGDLIDRGPSPVGVVRFVRELGAESVKGNHDEKPVRWHRHETTRKLTGKANPMKRPDATRQKEWESLSEGDLQWIDALPWTIQLAPGWIGVHAGFEPSLGLEEQSGQKMCRVRYVGENSGTMVKTEHVGHVPDGSVYWTTWSGQWKAPPCVVYGHAVHDTKAPRIDKLGTHGLLYGIDTGCVFGGVLTAWIHDGSTVQTVSVPSKRSYADISLVDE